MDVLQGVLQNASPRATDFLIGAMTDTSNDIFTESQRQVPVRYGVLKASGHVDPPDVIGNQIRINIGYGGPATYALFVHERLDLHHKPPTKAKYLEDPMNDALRNLTSRLQDRMEGAIVGSYPGSPARAAQAEATADMGHAYRDKTSRRIASEITRSPAMSAEEVHAGLAAIGARARSRRRGR